MSASPTPIIATCNELIAEAEAIIKYTNDLELIKDGDSKTVKTFEDIRADELEHVQKLTLALTELMGGEEEGGQGPE